MKIFISQPMNGKTSEEIYRERQEVSIRIRSVFKDAEIIDSLLPPIEKPLLALSYSLALMSEADCVYFMQGWQEARGCCIEHDCCIAYGIKTLYSF